MITHNLKVNADTAVLMVVDVQERFAPVIDRFAELVEATLMAVTGASILHIPIVITEQYPKGLGHTVAKIKSAALECSCFEKTTFSALGNADCVAYLEDSPAKQVVLAGVEAHVCLAQTAIDLIACGYDVFILEECISSRTRQNATNGIERMKKAGAIPYNVESLFFDALGSSAHPQFKAISQLVK